MKVKRGDVVLVDFPFSSGGGGKVRPALVVQSDAGNAKLLNTVVAMVTSTTRLAASTPTQILVDVAVPDGRSSGLLHASAVKCENLFTVEQRLVRRVIGRLSATLMNSVNAGLKASLDLA